jgi:hypothetical protein
MSGSQFPIGLLVSQFSEPRKIEFKKITKIINFVKQKFEY